MANGILANPSGYRDIDGVLWGWCWQINQPNNHTLLSYSFPKSTASYVGYTAVNGFEAFNAKQQAAAIKVLHMFDNVCNVDFQYTADPTQANIRMAEANSINVGSGNFNLGTAYGIAPDPNNAPAFSHGDTWFNHTFYNTPTLGNFAFASGIMHEIGHALGLKHGHVPDDVLNASGQYAYSVPALSFDHGIFGDDVPLLSWWRNRERQCDRISLHADAGRHPRSAMAVWRQLRPQFREHGLQVRSQDRSHVH
jgi:serralysin